MPTPFSLHKDRRPDKVSAFVRCLLVCVTLNLPLVVPAIGPPMQLVAPGLLVVWCHALPLRWSALMLLCGVALGGLLAMQTGLDPLMFWLVQEAGLAGVFLAAKERNLAGDSVFLSGVLFLVGTFLLVLFLMSGGHMAEAYRQVVEAVSKDLDKSLALYKEAMTQPDTTGLDAWLQQVRATVLRFLPGMLFSMFVAMSIVNLMVARLLLRWRYGLDVFGPRFKAWSFPEFMVWLGILSGMISLLAEGVLKEISDNVLMSLGVLYLLQGLAIISSYFSRFQVPVVVQGIIYLLISIQWYGLLFVALMGLFDTWFDFRSRFGADAGSKNR